MLLLASVTWAAIVSDDEQVPPIPAGTQAPPQSEPASPSTEPAPSQTTEDVGHVSKRLFGFFPNYRAADQQQKYMHPSMKEKFEIAWYNTVDWPNFLINAGYALQTQVSQNGLHGKAFGSNFGEYYARTFADSFVGNFVTEAFLPSLLGEDPRYYRSGKGSGWQRTFRAISQVAITRGVNGNKRINLSELGGNVIVIGVTNLYYPDQHHSLGSAAQRWGLAIGNDALANVLTEFLPDLQRKMRRKHAKPPSPRTTPNSNSARPNPGE
jgi:hypothetical protein